jgi:hypothetical protein
MAPYGVIATDYECGIIEVNSAYARRLHKHCCMPLGADVRYKHSNTAPHHLVAPFGQCCKSDLGNHPTKTQVVPDCQSRSALGETCDGGLAEIFVRDYGPPGSRGFETARNNFLRSEAGCVSRVSGTGADLPPSMCCPS